MTVLLVESHERVMTSYINAQWDHEHNYFLENNWFIFKMFTLRLDLDFPIELLVTTLPLSLEEDSTETVTNASGLLVRDQMLHNKDCCMTHLL